MIFIYGEEEYLVNLETQKFIQSWGAEPVIYTDSDPIENIIMDATTVSIFDTTKTIVIKNHDVFHDEKLAAQLVKEIAKDVEHINLICVLEEAKISKSNSLIAWLLQKAQVIVKEKIGQGDMVPTIKSIVTAREGEISNAAAIRLANKLPLNLRIAVTEIEKLLMENKVITETMIDQSIGDYLNDDYFSLTNAIIASDRRAIVDAYHEKLKAGETTQLIIGQIASILNLAMLVHSYKKQGLSAQDISDTLSIHIFRIKKAQELIAQSGSDTIEKLLISLAKLDKEIKIGILDEEKGMDNFILQLIR